ncbi:MAG: hypothetical protein ACJ73L_00140 [Actinomycetes bacterium]
MTKYRTRLTVLTLLTGVAASMALPLEAAEASLAQSSVVSANPANFTPNVEADGAVSAPAVHALKQLGGTMYAGGEFRTVTDASGTTSYQRNNIMAFSATTGAMTSFAPVINGTVWAIEASGSSIYVGGDFTTVNGVARRGLVKLDAQTGQIDKTFQPVIKWGNVTEIRLVNGRLIVGGSFQDRLAALDPVTGANTGYINLPITGRVADNSGPTKVYRFAVNPAGTRLMAIGNFTAVNGSTRWQAFMLDLGTTQATLDPWYYQPLQNFCQASSLPAYLRDVDFSPDGSYFVIVSTGYVPKSGGVGRDLCDAAARFETGIASPTRPTWINYTGGDTLHSVAVTGAAVYVQGHQRWLDNPFGTDSAGPGAVSRQGIGAIDPVRGTALSWNPGKTRGVGGKDLLATSSGLWVGSDGTRFAGEYRARIAFCPL